MMTPVAGGLKFMTSTPFHNAGNFNPPITPYLENGGGGGGAQETNERFTTEELNKSDSEKVLAKKFGSVNFRTDDLDILYNARGKEIERLERQLAEGTAEYETQLREARHQLALARCENHNNNWEINSPKATPAGRTLISKIISLPP